jgi:chromate transport protein ChrA
VIVAAMLVGAWVYAFSKGDIDQLDWVSLALRLTIFVLALLNMVVHLSALGWLALAAFLLWIATEIVAWRRRAPQRAEQRQLRQQHRNEVEAVLDHYRRTHPPDDAARGSSSPPEGGT